MHSLQLLKVEVVCSASRLKRRNLLVSHSVVDNNHQHLAKVAVFLVKEVVLQLLVYSVVATHQTTTLEVLVYLVKIPYKTRINNSIQDYSQIINNKI